jgi:cbb3-type cytochrome oxidase cytochrome c subunit
MSAMKFKQLQFTPEERIDDSYMVNYHPNIDENYNLNYMIREYDVNKLLESSYPTRDYSHNPHMRNVRDQVVRLAYNAQKNGNQYLYELWSWSIEEYSDIMAYFEDLQTAISTAQTDMQDTLSLFLENN